MEVSSWPSISSICTLMGIENHKVMSLTPAQALATYIVSISEFSRLTVSLMTRKNKVFIDFQV